MKDGLNINERNQKGEVLRKNVIFLSPAFEYGYSTEFMDKISIDKMLFLFSFLLIFISFRPFHFFIFFFFATGKLAF